MKCLNCNLNIPDDAKACPFCKAKTDVEHKRCPKCFIKLRINQTVCPNCGYDIGKSNDADFVFHKSKSAEKEYFVELSKKISRHKVLYFAIMAIIVVCIAITVYFVHAFNTKNSYLKALNEYSTVIKESMENVEILAEAYNNVYDGEWLNQVNNIAKLEKKHDGIIKDCKSERDSINYLYNQLKMSTDKDDENKIIKKAFKSYEKCYLYVVEKYGKYPGYMDEYKLLTKKYEADIKELDRFIEKSEK